MTVKVEIKIKSKRGRSSSIVKEFKKQAQKLYKKLGINAVRNIKHEIKKRHLIKSGDMYKSVDYKVLPNGVKIQVDSPAQYLEKGIKPHKMRYLIDSKSSIPVDAVNGIFRWATAEGIKRGKWRHPGFTRGKGFIKKSMKQTKQQFGEEIKDLTRKLI